MINKKNLQNNNKHAPTKYIQRYYPIQSSLIQSLTHAPPANVEQAEGGRNEDVEPEDSGHELKVILRQSANAVVEEEGDAREVRPTR